MKWNKYSFKANNDSVDILSALLCDEGIEGIEVEDHKALSDEDTKGMFIDILPDVGEDDGTATVSFYLDPADKELEAKLAAARQILKQFGGDADIVQSQTADVDWINNWKEFFHPLSVGNVLVKPTWEDVPVEDRDKILIEIDPGTAFGTGGHETTQLCMLELEKYVKGGEQILDLGTGSGILGIVAIKLGEAAGKRVKVVGTDLDDNAIEAVGENMQTNNIPSEDFTVICGNIIDDKSVQDDVGYERYDIVVANILAPVIIMLVDEVARHMKPGALFITSGIINTKEDEVLAAFKANKDFEIVEVNHLGEWVNVTARKK